jgi:hypothetical protein
VYLSVSSSRAKMSRKKFPKMSSSLQFSTKCVHLPSSARVLYFPSRLLLLEISKYLFKNTNGVVGSKYMDDVNFRYLLSDSWFMWLMHRKRKHFFYEETNKCTYDYIRCLLITPTCFGRLLRPSSGCRVLTSAIKTCMSRICSRTEFIKYYKILKFLI